MHELMAGSRRVATACCKQGVTAYSWEIADNSCEDCLHPKAVASLTDSMERGDVACIWIGLVCASWTRARRNTRGYGHGFPPPLRGKGSLIWGLPGLSPADTERVSNGNRQARWATKLFLKAAKLGIPIVIENPASSRLWELPALQALLVRFHSVTVHYCAFGMPWKKPTKLLFTNCDLHPLGTRLCRGRLGMCSFSGERHTVLSGRSAEHKALWTAVASPYPQALCRAAAKCLFP
jgi:hypothetical protein